MPADSPRPTDVAIVGLAALFPGAGDADTFWRNIVAGGDAITDVPDTRWDAAYYDPDAWAAPASDRFYCRRGGFIDDLATFDPAAFGIMPLAVDTTEPDQLLALRVAAAAILDAGGEPALGDRSRVGVILGRGGYLTPGLARLEQRVRVTQQLVASLRDLVPDLTEAQLAAVRQDFQARIGPERPEASIGLVPNLAASRIANRLDLQGPAYTVDGACASSLLAVDQAVAELAGGRCDLVLAGGVHVCDDVPLWSVFSQLKALSPSQQIRPFDRRADGLLIGEGTGMVALRRLADAERRGDRIYAVIRGTGVASDGRDSSLMRPRVEGQTLALRRAWAAAGLDPAAPGAVGLIEAHGTATPVGDEAELTTLRQVFGSEGPEIGLGSVKSMIGHAMPAAGIAGLIKAALAVHHRVLPPTLHCDEPHPLFHGSRLAPIGAATEWAGPDARRPWRAAFNAFGFGGINAHVVLEAAPSAVAAPSQASWPTAPPPAGVSQRVLLLAGATAEEVGRQLAADDADLVRRDDLHTAPAGGPWRLAIVDPNPTRLDLARKVVARGRPWRGRNEVWFTGEPLLAGGAGQVAFLFPGVEQSFDPRAEGVAEQFGLAPARIEGTGTLGRHSVATVSVGRLFDGALRALGIEPDVVAGHSIGEWNAMIAAGMHDGAAIDKVIRSFETDSVDVPGLVFAALGCGAEMAEAAIVGLPDVVVSHDNCPHQSIICGDEASVAIACERLRAESVMSQVLAFRSGFHSPMVEPYLAPVGTLLGGLELHPARTPVWSATIAGAYPSDPVAVRDLTIRHLLEPVRFGPMIDRLYAAGVRAFIQVGSGSLTGFVDDTLRERDQLTISASSPKQNGVDQLLRVAAALWVEGRAPRFSALSSSPRGMKLRLGTPIVRLEGGVRPLGRGNGQADATPPSSHPLLAEFQALLTDATSAADAVLRSWQAPRSSRTSRVVSVETMPYLRDHCFYRQAEGSVVGDRFPVVPMTTMLEMILDAARPLAGGRMLVGLSKVRALRWLAPVEPVTVTITAAVDIDGNVDVELEGYARAKVLVADRYAPAPWASAEPLSGEGPSPVPADRVYEDRWLFHGPEFQGVAEVRSHAGNGMRGRLVSLPAPGALLDNAGQLFGLWMQLALTEDALGFPAAVEAMEFFGPHPTPGTALECAVWVRSVKDTTVTADLELVDASGRVWARIEGWTDRRFRTDATIFPLLRWPESHRLAEVQPGGWFLLRDRWHDPANRELIMRRYLDAGERRGYEEEGPRGRHRWLLGRMAAKEALRQWHWDRGAGALYPAQFAIANDDAGRPFVTGRLAADRAADPGGAGATPGPGLSIAHAGDVAVALVGAGDVGIDVEVVEPRTREFEEAACTEGERALLDASGVERSELVTRFWCAKEAVAKAIGTGLGGRPRSFQVIDVDGTELLVAAVDHGTRWRVDTAAVVDGATTYVVGWTAAAAWPPEMAELSAHPFSRPQATTERNDNGR